MTKEPEKLFLVSGKILIRLAALVIALSILVLHAVAWADFNLSINLGVPPPVVVLQEEVELGNRLTFEIVSAELVVPYSTLLIFHQTHRLPPAQVALIFYLARETGYPVTHIYRLRTRGHGWGRIAKELGLHPSVIARLNRRDAPEVYSTWVLARHYGLPYERVIYLKERGYQISEIALGINLASRANRDAAEIFKLRGKGQKWRDVARHYGKEEEELRYSFNRKGPGLHKSSVAKEDEKWEKKSKGKRDKE